MPDLLLTAQNARGHIHLVIGSCALANARCTNSLRVGAIPKIIAPIGAVSKSSGLANRVADGEVEWIKKDLSDIEEVDLRTNGRWEVDCFVDAVFVTVRGESGK